MERINRWLATLFFAVISVACLHAAYWMLAFHRDFARFPLWPAFGYLAVAAAFLVAAAVALCAKRALRFRLLGSNGPLWPGTALFGILVLWMLVSVTVSFFR
jgi:hypothetical protein